MPNARTTRSEMPLREGAPAAPRRATFCVATARTSVARARGAADRAADPLRTGGAVRHRATEALGVDARDEPSPELLRLLAHLRSTVTTYVIARRDEGAPIERVVPEVKCLVRESESCEGWRDPSDALLAQVVRWSIEAYDDEPSLPHVPRFY